MHMKNYGFTFLELIFVIAIIGMLTGTILPVFLHGGLDEGLNTLQSSIFSAKTLAVTKRKTYKLELNANYLTGQNPLPCTLSVIEGLHGTATVKLYRLPKYIRFWQYNSEVFDEGTQTVYFEPHGISYGTLTSSRAPQDTKITLLDERTRIRSSPVTTTRTIIGNTCKITKE